MAIWFLLLVLVVLLVLSMALRLAVDSGCVFGGGVFIVAGYAVEVDETNPAGRSYFSTWLAVVYWI